MKISFILDSLSDAKANLGTHFISPTRFNVGRTSEADDSIEPASDIEYMHDNTPPSSPTDDHSEEDMDCNPYSIAGNESWLDTPPTTPLTKIDQTDSDDIDESMELAEDVICLSNHNQFESHKPISNWDSLSGSRTFEFMADSSRRYALKSGKRLYLKKRLVDSLKYCNKSNNCRNDDKTDSEFIELLLLSFVPIKDLKCGNIEKEVLNLIKGKKLKYFEFNMHFKSSIVIIFLQTFLMFVVSATVYEWPKLTATFATSVCS